MRFAGQQRERREGKLAPRMGALFLATMVGAVLAVGTRPQAGPALGLAPAQAAPQAGQLVVPVPGKAGNADVNHQIADGYPRLQALYQRLHSHPELSSQEALTAARLAHALEGTGF